MATAPSTGASTNAVGVVLAAGMSTRLGRPKQLLPLGDETVVWWTARHALDAGLDAVVVVTGAAADAVGHALGGLPIRVVENPDFATGQASSLRAGIAALPGDTGAVVMLLGDQPELAPAAIDAIVARWRTGRAPIVMAGYRDRSGHPVLFGRELFAELLAIDGDQGARQVIRRHQDRVLTVPLDVDAPADIDDEPAYQALRQRWAVRQEVARG